MDLLRPPGEAAKAAAAWWFNGDSWDFLVI
jgi:hypothetical protein